MTPYSWSTEWFGMVLIDNILLPNHWKIKFNFEIIDDDPLTNDIAMQRIEYMFNDRLRNSMWAKIDNEFAIEWAKKLDTYIITVPMDPSDSLIANIINSKLEKIVGDVVEIISVEISSDLGYNIVNHLTYDELKLVDYMVQDFDFDPWYKRTDAGFTDAIEILEDGNKRIVSDFDAWSKLYLDFDQFSIESSDTNKSRPMIKTNWKPTVIKGGKNQSED